MPGATSIHHYGLTVSDMERSLAWYKRVFGLLPGIEAGGSGEVIETLLQVPDASLQAIFLSIGDVELELLYYDSPEVLSPPARLAESDVGAGHVCLRVDDIHAAHHALLAEGIAVTREPFEVPEGDMAGYWILRLHDPDGARIELFQLPATSGA
jgi:catechol 2,3-dioxygenase-like lactoylglutathione lyase family enzyme